MAPVIEVRRTFLHLREDSDDESSDGECAMAPLRSTKKALTTGSSSVLGRQRAPSKPCALEAAEVEGGGVSDEATAVGSDAIFRMLSDASTATSASPRPEDAGDQENPDGRPMRKLYRLRTFDPFESSPAEDEELLPGPASPQTIGSPSVDPAAPAKTQQGKEDVSETEQSLDPKPLLEVEDIAKERLAAPELASGSVVPPQELSAVAAPPLPQPVILAMSMAMPSPFVQVSPIVISVAPQPSPILPAESRPQQRAEQQQQQQQRQQQHKMQGAHHHHQQQPANLPEKSGRELLRPERGSQPPSVASTLVSNPVTCAVLPAGGARIRWQVDARRFSGRDATVVSPALVLDLPAFGPHHFKVLVHAATTKGSKSGPGFRASRGHGRIELKCDTASPGPGRELAEGQEYTVRVHKTHGAKLGLDLASQGDEPWRVKSISAGLIGQWNACRTGVQVLPGDHLLEANGIRGSATKVRDECAKTGPLRLVLRRGPLTSPSFHISFGASCGSDETTPAVLRGPVLHSFAEQSCCGLRREDEDFDLASIVRPGSRQVAIHVEVRPARE